MRGRVLILIGAVILLAVVVVVVLMSQSGEDGDTETATEDGAGTTGVTEPGDAVPFGAQRIEDLVEIVIAIQDMPRGLIIPADGVSTQLWPRESLPEAGQYYLADQISEVIGRIARTDLVRGAPILSRQLVDNLADIAETGSDAAAILGGLPDDGRTWVAVSIPLDPSGIGQAAYAIQDGDYVDVILSYLFVDVDPAFQTRLPNNISIITRLETGELSIGAPRQGRPEASTLTVEGVLLGPAEASQRPRLVTQRSVTDAFVVHVGYFPPDGRIVGATPTPQIVATLPPPPGEETGGAPTPLPTATEYVPLIITLGVTPQDALVLTWAVDAQIPITLALREAGDRSVTTTDPVSLDYMIRTFNAAPPDALEFALEPPITSVRRFDIGTLYGFLASSIAE
jgi:Flp pilus assembly protein CpaB